MSKIWPHEKIRELLALADASGESRATLASAREAELFRFAIYNFRRNQWVREADHYVGHDIEITIDDKTILLRKRKDPFVTMMQETETQN